jgi:DNA-binding response OmpR family regulator
MAADSSDARTRTVLVYSDDPVIRNRVITSIGRRPAGALGAIDYLQADTGEGAVRAVRTGEVDLCILDGEAWPTGGMAICRQLKDELDHCPPLLLLIGRRDDAWLGTWSRADAMVTHPIDLVDLTASAVKLLTPAAGPLPAAAPG